MDSRSGRPDENPDDASPDDERLGGMLAELDRLRRAGIFTEEQFEDERRRLRREADEASSGGAPGMPS